MEINIKKNEKIENLKYRKKLSGYEKKKYGFKEYFFGLL